MGRVAGSASLSSSGMICWASTFPSSTPHWSNESMSQIAPWVKTLCSYSATSFPSAAGRQPLQQERVGWAIALEGAVRHQPCRRAFGLNLLRGFAKGQRLRLREHVGQEHVVMAAERVKRLHRTR